MNKKITLFLADGLPRGLRSVRIDQWVGKAVSAPRNRSKNIDLGEIEGSASLYFLIGPNDNGLPDLYVGETDIFSKRLSQHDYKKDWWQELVVFYSQDKSLTKTGVRYLERICIDRLRQAAKCNLRNGNEGTTTVVPMEDRPGLDEFFANVALILPLLGYDVFEQRQMAIVAHEETVEGVKIYCEAKGARAQGLLLEDGKILVQKGSTAIKQNADSFNHHNYNRLKTKLLEIGRLSDQGDYLVFTDDYEFSSPSAAAAIILARAAAGPREWHDAKGRTLQVLLDE